jgi:enamine deaminase RidA (YjgF/YER057c/UK114 family)
MTRAGADGAADRPTDRPTDALTNRRRVSSGGPWEASVGYSRAIAVGDSCWVSGTTDAGPDGVSRHPGDAGAQAVAVFDIIERALAEAGFELGDIVRTRMFVTPQADAEAVLATHGTRLGAIRPAATLVTIAALLHPSLLVEIEAEARRA